MSVHDIINDLWTAFDRDQNGYLDQKEATNLMRLIFKEMRVPYSAQKADELFKMIDLNGDGQISKQEFAYMLERA